MPIKKLPGDFSMPGPGKGGVSFDIKWKKRAMPNVPPPKDISKRKRKRSESMEAYNARRQREMHG